MKKKVSVIVPIYNAEKYLKKCLDSIINQTYQDLEIILINDGSLDYSLKLCEEYKKNDKRIVVINQKNAGVSVARNNGISKASGDYVTFVDSDDWLEFDAIEKMVEVLENNDCQVIMTNCYINKDYDNSIKQKETFNRLYNSDQIKDELIIKFLTGKLNCFVVLLLIKRECLIDSNIKFDDKLCMMEDKEFYINLLFSINKFYLLNYYTYHYYQNNNSVTHSAKKINENIESTIRVNEMIKQRLISNNISNEIIKMSETFNLLIIIGFLYMQFLSNKREAKKLFERLRNDAKILKILNNLSLKDVSLYKKISIKLFKKNKRKMLFTMFKFKSILKKIKR